MAKKTSKTTTTKRRKNPSTSTKAKGERLTPNQKLTFHLNEALAVENGTVTKTPVTNKTDKNRQC